MEGHAATRNHTVLARRDREEVPAATLAEVIYMVGNGQGKARAGLRGETTSAGEVPSRDPQQRELSSRDHGAVAGMAMPDGTSIRLIDVRADGQQHGAFDTLHGAPRLRSSPAGSIVRHRRCSARPGGTSSRR